MVQINLCMVLTKGFLLIADCILRFNVMQGPASD